MKAKELWIAECNMRALGLISDLREGTMQPCEISQDDWRHIRRVRREMKAEDKEWKAIKASVKVI